MRKTVGWMGSPGAAFVVLVAIVLGFGYGQEVIAWNFPVDDYYFLLRSESWHLMGSHFASVKEPLYPLFLHLPRALGIQLRTFEAGAYGAAIFVLWLQLLRLTGSKTVAWLSVLPLSLCAYQHPVFNRVTYDALQLILTPLSFAAAIGLYVERGSRRMLALNGLMAGLQALTRPEGILFILPAMAALALVAYQGFPTGIRAATWAFVKKAVVIAAIPFGMQEALSAANAWDYGYWAPTLVKSHNYQACLKDLMAIAPPPSAVTRYVPVQRSALEMAYRASPSLALAKPYFALNLDGKGWSNGQYKEHEAQEGNIMGGYFQWALLEGGAWVTGEDTRALNAYFGRVKGELDRAFANGSLPHRTVLATFVGPEYSLFSQVFFSSAVAVAKRILNFTPTPLPESFGAWPEPKVENDFDRLALRDLGRVRSPAWQMTLWVTGQGTRPVPSIALDQTALLQGIILSRDNTPYPIMSAVAKHLAQGKTVCRLSVTSPGPREGSLVLDDGSRRTTLPLGQLLTTRSAADAGGLRVEVGEVAADRPSPDFRVQDLLTKVTYGIMQGLIPLTLVAFLAALYRASRGHRMMDGGPLWLVWTATLSVVLARGWLFAAIDSRMYTGVEARYLAAGVFSMWFFASFTAANLYQRARSRWRREQA